jgi:hypothetical protein
VVDLVADIRAQCARVAGSARHVAIEHDQIAPYAQSLELETPAELVAEPRDAAFWLTLDAINFGSGWFPTLRKRPGHSGYHTVAAGLRERFEANGPYAPTELAAIDATEIAATLGQDPEHELMELFAQSLNDLGARLREAGGFEGVLASAGDSAVTLASTLARWECFADVSTYDGQPVPFYKRAQIAAADLARARAYAPRDLDRLTIFADNLVPHVLRLDGILTFAPDLVARIDREELLEHDSPEEVEIRACALHAVELIVAARGGRDGINAAHIDEHLWRRGGLPQYKARPRHRSRCTAY